MPLTGIRTTKQAKCDGLRRQRSLTAATVDTFDPESKARVSRLRILVPFNSTTIKSEGVPSILVCQRAEVSQHKLLPQVHALEAQLQQEHTERALLQDELRRLEEQRASAGTALQVRFPSPPFLLL